MTDIFGWQYYHYAELDSTNDKAKEFCTGTGRRTVIRCDKQNKGRGRRGRSWTGLEGNLFFSLAFEFNLCYIGHLVAISALSLAQTILALNNEADVKLKWPNDVLLNGAKISGILLEKGAGEYIIVGIGVNIMHSPVAGQTPYATASLAEAGIQTDAETFMKLYLVQFNASLEKLRKQGFDIIQKEWLSLAANLGKEIAVRQNDTEKRGIFTGIDNDAGLLLKTPAGIEKILVGDVFFIEK